MFNFNNMTAGEVFMFFVPLIVAEYLEEKEWKKQQKAFAEQQALWERWDNFKNSLEGSYDEHGDWYENGYYDMNDNLIVGYEDRNGNFHQGFIFVNDDGYEEWYELGMYLRNGQWLNYRRR